MQSCRVAFILNSNVACVLTSGTGCVVQCLYVPTG
uniref:Uncharacterized protein n=1 Tax=Anguilla anguilla TaxID=7936 RepID=A0A0E9UQN1_ANGAN